MKMFSSRGLWLGLVCAAFCSGCATSKIDWASRVDVYTYQQAVLDFGPPDKQAKLEDGTTVAEWLTGRTGGYATGFFDYGYPGCYWRGPYFPGFYSPIYYTPGYDSFLRLTFGPEGRLKAWRKVYK
jgi:hypothetical protein